MSLSDEDTFEPLAVQNLEQFDEESQVNSDRVAPDFDRFKALFDEADFKKGEDTTFTELYQFKQDTEPVSFTPMIDAQDPDKRRSKEKEKKASSAPGENEKDIDESGVQELEPELTEAEKGFQKGFDQGLEQGQAQGKEEGFQKGFETGEKEGLEKGEEKGLEAGREKGFEQGLKEGTEQGQAQVVSEGEKLLATLEQMLDSLENSLETVVDRYEEQIIDLIGHIARKVILTHVEMDDEAVKPLIVDALKTLVKPEEIVLTVSSEDYEYIEMIKDDFFAQFESLRRISVHSDGAMDKGSFHIETETGELFSDINTKLDAIASAMKQAGGS